ncbi:MAG: choice-of-anchor D domain-containing protein [Acidobacteriota bacterium]
MRCTDFFHPEIAATTVLAATFTFPPVINGTTNEQRNDFTATETVTSNVAAKLDMTAPSAKGWSLGIANSSTDCALADSSASNSPWTGSKTITLSQDCLRGAVRSIVNQKAQTFYRTTVGGQSVSLSSNSPDGFGALSPPAVLFQVDAYYNMEVQVTEDLMITAIHPVQAVQTPQEHVTLIGGKRTVARIFIKSVGTSAKAVPGVSAILRCDAPAGRFSAKAGTAPITAPAITAAPAPGTPPDLSEVSVDVVVPEKCMVGGTAPSVEAEIILPGGVTDPNLANNRLSRNFVFVTPPGSQPFKIAYLRVEIPGVGKSDAARAASADGQLRLMYPIPDGGVRYFPFRTDVRWGQEVSSVEGYRRLLAALSRFVRLDEPAAGSEYDQVVAFLPRGANPAAGGAADMKANGGNSVALLVTDSQDPVQMRSSLAHEVAHNVGIRHTNVAAPTFGCVTVARDGQTAWPNADARIGTYSYSQPSMVPLSPNLFDLMSYCPKASRWMSPYTFESLIANDLRPTGGLPPRIVFREEMDPDQPHQLRRAAPQDLWLVSGSVLANGTGATLDPLLKVNSSQVPDTSNPGGTHCIRFTLAGGATSSHCFTPSFTDPDQNARSEAFFNFLLPIQSGATRAALLAGTRELAALTAAASLQVNITSPQAGERWEGSASRTIVWTSSGGSGTHYAVQYSPSGGTSWTPLSPDETGTQLTVDPARLQGGANVRFRVLAGSGLTTASAEVGPINIVQVPKLDVPSGTVEMHNAVATQRVEHPLLLSNSGTGPVTITAAVSNSDQFAVVSPSLPTVIFGGEQMEMIVAFSPTAEGDVAGTLRLDSNDATRPSVTIPLHGKGLAATSAEMGVSPASIAFGTLQQGQGATRTVTITNYGPAALNVTSLFVVGSGFTLATPFASFTLAVNESSNVLVRYAPNSTGANTATLTVSSNDAFQPTIVVALSGTGTAASGAARPSIKAAGVVNAASFLAGVSRGALGTIFGTNLANGTQVVSVVPWPRQMQGAKVLVGGIEAPLYYVSPTQINFQVPFEVGLGSVPVIVTRDGLESTAQNTTVSTYAVGVFGYARTATDFDPIVIHLDGSLVTPSKPAQADEFLLVFLTGIGGLEEFPPTGDVTPADPLPGAVSPMQATLGGAPVQVFYAGLTPGFIGLAQMNLQLPQTLSAGSVLPLVIRPATGPPVTVNLAVK